MCVCGGGGGVSCQSPSHVLTVVTWDTNTPTVTPDQRIPRFYLSLSLTAAVRKGVGGFKTDVETSKYSYQTILSSDLDEKRAGLAYKRAPGDLVQNECDHSLILMKDHFGGTAKIV